METAYRLTAWIEEHLLLRNEIVEPFFAREALRMTEAGREMGERFLRGGRLLAFGRGSYATDAQHVSVEFVHPEFSHRVSAHSGAAGRRSLPALDLSMAFQPWLDAILRPEDIAMGFGPPESDPEVLIALASAYARKAMTFALPGPHGSYTLEAATLDPFIHQEMIEIFHHMLWETVHVFLEPRDPGQEKSHLVAEAAASIRRKVRDGTILRMQLADEQAEQIGSMTVAMHRRLSQGGRLIFFGNGGSATDANDWALDCILPPAGYHSIPAISLSMEPASITALASDVGPEGIFLRQLIAAQARPDDVAIGISTSGDSRNVVVTLEEARRRGLLTVALLGCDGGEIYRRNLVDFPLVVRSDHIQRVQEAQASAYHVIREMLEVLYRDGA